MPELPEVEHAARSLGAQVTGAQIVGLSYIDWERMIETPTAAIFADLIAGRQIIEVGRRAKWIVATLDQGWTLALHLRMSGVVTVQGPEAQPNKHTRFVLGLSDGRQIFFDDTRKFGRLRLLDAQGLALLDQAHGVEPLSEAFTPSLLAQIVSERGTRIKPLLLDQTKIAGIGNIYADEALWHAQIHPMRAASSLSADEIERLHASIIVALQQGITHGGSTLRDYRNSYGEKGNNQEHFRVYNQQGEPCPRCGSMIEKTIVAQRGTHYCPNCQTL